MHIETQTLNFGSSHFYKATFPAVDSPLMDPSHHTLVGFILKYLSCIKPIEGLVFFS